MVIRAGLLLAAALALAPSAAPACIIADAETALIHDAIPADPDPRLIIARIDIKGPLPERPWEADVPARIRTMVQGRYAGETLILRSLWKSCSRPFANGSSGLIVAIPLAMEGDLLVVQPIEVSRNGGYRLRKGYRVPDEYLASLRRRTLAQ